MARLVLRRDWIMVIVLSNLPKPSNAKYSHCTGMITESGGRQTIDGNQPQGRRTVDDEEIVIVANAFEGVLHPVLAILDVNHLDLRAHQVDMGGQQIEVREVGLNQDVAGTNSLDHALVDAVFNFFGVKAQPRGRVGLWVGIHDERPEFQSRQTGGEIDGRGGFPRRPLFDWQLQLLYPLSVFVTCPKFPLFAAIPQEMFHGVFKQKY